MIPEPQKTDIAKPPRPTKTLADIRRRSELCWRASLILIWEWMEATIPGTVCGLAGEGKLEAVERLYDQGYLRFHRTDPDPKTRYRLWAEVWDGTGYQRVGKDPNGNQN
jgi:hypothetical protein